MAEIYEEALDDLIDDDADDDDEISWMLTFVDHSCFLESMGSILLKNVAAWHQNNEFEF